MTRRTTSTVECLRWFQMVDTGDLSVGDTVCSVDPGDLEVEPVDSSRYGRSPSSPDPTVSRHSLLQGIRGFRGEDCVKTGGPEP